MRSCRALWRSWRICRRYPVWDSSVFTVTKFDRFARNMAEANDILTSLSGRGVLFGVGMTIHDWSDPCGQLFLQTLAET
ncbi:hypothetical protein FXF59_09330 [Microbispora tritici]|uniref:Resolvase/invertase-type recombinase catalytic domain-containing protein n=2 Tax=Microbispora TaxID=2005 RepID=A0ABY3M0R1_9ACTN|nr:hypothetical protein FED44_30755 [Microbispora fusca]TYB62864.1 hypothetical protein FXF59_09330 [Microbispora tritici]